MNGIEVINYARSHDNDNIANVVHPYYHTHSYTEHTFFSGCKVLIQDKYLLNRACEFERSLHFQCEKMNRISAMIFNVRLPNNKTFN